MRNRIFRCQHAVLISCGFLPVPIILCHFWNGADLLPWLIAPLCCLVLSCLCMLIPGKWRLAAAIPGLIGMCAVTWYALLGESIGSRILLPALYSILLLFTLPIAGWERGRELPSVIPAVGICAHLLIQFLLFVKPSPIPGVSPLLMGAFLVFLSLFMLSLNRQSMASSMPDDHTVPVSIRRRNRLLTWILLGIVLLISLIPALGKIVQRVMEWLKIAIIAIVNWILSLFATKEVSGESGGAAQDMLGGLGGGEASNFAKILEKVFVVIASIAIALIALWGLRFLWRRLKQLVLYLYGQLRHYASTASEDYVDELEDTREQGGEHLNIAQRILRRRSVQRNLKELPPREQIRTRYGLMRGRHPEWEKSATARETLNSASASLYEKARYSSHEITQDDSEAFASQQSR